MRNRGSREGQLENSRVRRESKEIEKPRMSRGGSLALPPRAVVQSSPRALPWPYLCVSRWTRALRSAGLRSQTPQRRCPPRSACPARTARLLRETHTTHALLILTGRYHCPKIHPYSLMEELFKMSELTKHRFEKQTGRFASRKWKRCFQSGFSPPNCSTPQSKTPAQHTQAWKMLQKLSIFSWLLITHFQLSIHLSLKCF